MYLENSEAVSGTPNLRERLAAFLLRRYPLKSGCGTLASSNLFGKLAGHRDINLWCDIVGGKALVPSTDLVGRAMFFAGDLDPKVSWVVDTYVKQGDITLDIGANLGLVTLRMAQKVGPSGQVHAFEPNPSIHKYLVPTLERNALSTVFLHKIALGSVASTLSLMVPKVNAGAASFVDVGGREVDYRVEVPVVRLDAFLAQTNLPRVDFIKMDVEGFEAEVLKGGSRMLRDMPPRVILFEENGRIDGEILPETLQLLIDNGYKIFGLPKRYVSVEMVPLDRVRKLGAHDFVALRA